MTPHRLLHAYVGSLVMAVFIGLICWWQGQSASDILPKILFAPVFIFACIGLDRFFPRDEARSRSWLRELERHTVEGALTVIMMIIVVPPQGLAAQLTMIAIFLGIYVPLRTFLGWRKPAPEDPHRNVTHL